MPSLRRCACLLLLSSAFAACDSSAPPATPDAGDPNPDFDRVLGPKLQAALDDGNAEKPCWGMTAAVWVPGLGLWRGANGLDDLQAETPMPRDGIFRIGSITKTFVATVFLQLEAEGKVSLDDTLDHYVDQYPGAKDMTMRQVMSHTAGVYNYSDNLVFLNDAIAQPTKVWKPAELLAYAASQEPYFEPGQGYHYSNTDYILAGLAVEKATGNPIHVEIRRRILDKLDLRETFFAGGNAEAAPPAPPPLVHGYDDTGRDLSFFYDMSASWAAGAIASSARDVTRFMRALLEGELLDATRLAEMRTVLGGGKYGIGLERSKETLGTGWGHDGIVLGYWTQSTHFEPGGETVTLFCDVFTLPKNKPLAKAWANLQKVLATRTGQ